MSNDLLFKDAPKATGAANLVFGEPDALGPGDLLFVGKPLAVPNLVFGEDTNTVPQDASLTLDAVLPAMSASATIVVLVEIELVSELPGMVCESVATYTSGAARPLVAKVVEHWQDAKAAPMGTVERYQQSQAQPSGAQTLWQDGKPLPAAVAPGWRDALRTKNGAQTTFQVGQRMIDGFVSQFDQAQADVRSLYRSLYERGVGVQSGTTTGFQQGLNDRRRWIGDTAQSGKPLAKSHSESGARALRSSTRFDTTYQRAMVPPPGKHATTPVTPPIPLDPCYLPDPNLLFSATWDGSADMGFWCERFPPPVSKTKIVSVKRVYMVVNNATLYRVDGNLFLPTFSMSLSIDFESWVWGFSATLPGSALASLEPAASGEPVEVEAVINGTRYRALIESQSRERTFGRSDLKISGRGKLAVLDAPYTVTQTFSASSDRTAQQLMNDALTINGVPLGWTVNWGLDDWTVPAGVWNHQGTYITALNAIAGAAGGYVLPDTAEQSLSVLPRYPVAPWNWDAQVTPDFELPSAVTTREAIEWVENARYNRIYVSGQQSGVLGQVTRSGTAGDALAPMVTDALVTAPAAARQRGLSVLGQAGRVANVTLNLPLLQETGVITPGKFVRYVDGGSTRLGLVRSTSLSVGPVETWQTIGVETHVA